MNIPRAALALLLIGGLFAAVTAVGAAETGVTPWPTTAEQIRKGKIDVGKKYGMGTDQRFHRIHESTLGLECATCHADRIPASARTFSVPPAVDVSQASPGPVDRRVCQGCHVGGPARDVYGSQKPSEVKQR